MNNNFFIKNILDDKSSLEAIVFPIFETENTFHLKHLIMKIKEKNINVFHVELDKSMKSDNNKIYSKLYLILYKKFDIIYIIKDILRSRDLFNIEYYHCKCKFSPSSILDKKLNNITSKQANILLESTGKKCDTCKKDILKIDEPGMINWKDKYYHEKCMIFKDYCETCGKLVDSMELLHNDTCECDACYEITEMERKKE